VGAFSSVAKRSCPPGIEVYEDYLRRQLGLSERTIIDSWQFAEQFLEFRAFPKRLMIPEKYLPTTSPASCKRASS
jgi:hypothetical protein